MKKILAIILAIIICSLLCCCNYSQLITINYSIPNDPVTLDSAIATDISSITIIQNILVGLYTTDQNGNLESGDAYRYSTNDDYTEFTFFLRENNFYSDGKTPITAKDYVFAIKRALDTKTNSPYAKDLYCIKNAENFNLGLCSFDEVGVKSMDDNSITFSLNYSYEKFPYLTTKTFLMPCNEEYYNSTKGMYGLESSSVLCNSAYCFSSSNSWEHNKSIKLKPNPNYYKEISKDIDDIVFKIGDESNLEELKKNELNAIALNPSENDYNEIKDYNSIYYEDTVWGLTFNFDETIYNDAQVRKELISSIDNSKNESELPYNCKLTDKIVPSLCTVSGEPYNNEGKENIDISDKDNRKNNFKSDTIICLDTPYNLAIASNIIESFNTVSSLHYNIKALPYDEFENCIAEKNYGIAIIPLSSGQGEAYDFLKVFSSDSEDNPCNFSDENYDNLLNQSLKEPSEIVECENYLIQNAVFCPLYFENRCFVYSNELEDVEFLPFNGGVNFSYTHKSL